MTSGEREVDIGGRGPTANTLHWIIHSSVLSQFWTPDVNMLKTTRLDQKEVTFKFSMHIFVYWPLPPYVHLTSIHVINAPTGTVYYCERRQKVRMGEAWERG